jgi:hypothetical protein
MLMNISTKAALFLLGVKSKFGKAKDIIKEENGDTNFISIIIILAIVLLVAVAFMIFKDQIIGWFNGTTKTFFDQTDSAASYTTSH